MLPVVGPSHHQALSAHSSILEGGGGGKYCDKTINIVQKTYTFFMAKSERGALEFTQNGYLKNKMADLGQGVLESYLGRPLMIDMSPQYCANGS